jgi:hypothetical protein
MNHHPGGDHSWRREVLAAVVAGMALLAAACSGSSPSGPATAGGSAAYHKALAFARCMRSHGQPGWPDPTSTGAFNTSQIDFNSLLGSSALNACRSLRPPGGVHFQLSGAQQQVLLRHGLKIAACMRAHGVPNFPDPDVQAAKAGGIGFSTAGLAPPGQYPSSPQFLAAQHACMPS